VIILTIDRKAALDSGWAAAALKNVPPLGAVPLLAGESSVRLERDEANAVLDWARGVLPSGHHPLAWSLVQAPTRVPWTVYLTVSPELQERVKAKAGSRGVAGLITALLEREFPE